MSNKNPQGTKKQGWFSIPKLAKPMTQTLLFVIVSLFIIKLATDLDLLPVSNKEGWQQLLSLFNGGILIAMLFLVLNQRKTIEQAKELLQERLDTLTIKLKTLEAQKASLDKKQEGKGLTEKEKVELEELTVKITDTKTPIKEIKSKIHPQVIEDSDEQEPIPYLPSFYELALVGIVFLIFLFAIMSIIYDFTLKNLSNNLMLLNSWLFVGIFIAASVVWVLTYKLVTEYKIIFEVEKDPETGEPRTQQRKKRQLWEWVSQLPIENIKDQAKDFRLISAKKEQKIVAEFTEQYDNDDTETAITSLKDDIEFLESVIGSVFRERDYEAKYYQLAYRRYQIAYMVLAALAGIFGSLLGLSFTQNTLAVGVFGFAETIVALATTYLATISGREAPLQEWLTNRQKAEGLRREYQRYLVRLEPYDEAVSVTARQILLKSRVAAINSTGSPDIDDEKIKLAFEKADNASSSEA